MTSKKIFHHSALLFILLISLTHKGAMAMTPTEFFKNLNTNTMGSVLEFYGTEAQFVDPMGEVRGAKNIQAYYAYQYKNAEKIEWTIDPEIIQGKIHILVWTMHLTATSLNGGKPFDVQGMSRFVIEEDGKASFHQDYFDAGAFVYEKIPLLKNIIFFVKDRMKKGLHDQEAAHK